MSAQPVHSKMSEEEYLAFERASEFKHEYVNGEIMDMAGASNEHILICSYTGAALIAALGDKPCNVYQNDLRIKASMFHSYRYPDIVVVCGKPKYSDDKFDTITNPTVIIEVLSPSTENEDRGKKLREYRQIESLQEYLLISQDSPVIERYMRPKEGSDWLYSEIQGMESQIKLPSLEISLALADVYKKVEFPEGSGES
jgi:Uma2 family endonuclease